MSSLARCCCKGLFQGVPKTTAKVWIWEKSYVLSKSVLTFCANASGTATKTASAIANLNFIYCLLEDVTEHPAQSVQIGAARPQPRKSSFAPFQYLEAGPSARVGTGSHACGPLE